MKNKTLKDIAKEAGFSIKTISRVVNKHPDVSKKTRERIEKLIAKYGYTPDPLARGLRRNISNVVGYIVPDIVNEYFGAIAIEIEKVFKKYDYTVLLGFSDGDAEEEKNVIKLLISRRVAGIILASAGENIDIVEDIIKNLKIPLVIIDNKVKELKTNFVLHDNINGAYKLTHHLIEHGYKDIACVTGPLNETSGKKRLEGFKKALKESGIEINNELIKISDWKISGGYDSTLELFQKSRIKPRAIFLANSIMALGSLKALKELKLKVPEDLALVSFDNLSFTEATDPPLTTLQKASKRIGMKASEILYERIKSGNLEKIDEIYISSDLCIRQSCGCNL